MISQGFENAKLLGLYIDFNDHTNSLVKHVSSKIAVLHRLHQFLSSNILNTVYLTTIQPIFIVVYQFGATRQNKILMPYKSYKTDLLEQLQEILITVHLSLI